MRRPRRAWVPIALAVVGSVLISSRAAAQAPPVGPLLLRLPASPRAAALGNAWVAGRDQDVLFYNPAQLIGARQGFDLSVTRHGRAGTAWSAGSVYAGGKWSLTLGWGAQFLDFSTSPTEPYPYAPDTLLTGGSASGFSTLFAAGGAFVYKGFRFGAAGKYASDRVSMPAGVDAAASVDRHALLADFGVARNILGGVGGLSVQNLRRDSVDGDSRLVMPRQLLMGWSRTKAAGPIDLALYTQAIVRHGWTSPGAGLDVGYSWIEGYNVALRVGARRPETPSEHPVTFGAALTVDRVTVEYAIQRFDGGRSANGVTIRWR